MQDTLAALESKLNEVLSLEEPSNDDSNESDIESTVE